MSTARGLKVIKNNVNKNTEYKSEFLLNVWDAGRQAELMRVTTRVALVCRWTWKSDSGEVAYTIYTS